jgi:hypothetical protein
VLTWEQLLDEVEGARNDLVTFLEPMDEVVAQAPIGDGRWSPVEYLEHLVRAEEATLWRMFTSIEEGRRGIAGPTSPTPGESIEQLVARTWGETVDAPPLAVPRLGGSLVYWLERMKRNRALVTAFAERVLPGELDTVAYDHPISGPFTMRQGMEFVRFHIARHHGHLVDAR